MEFLVYLIVFSSGLIKKLGCFLVGSVQLHQPCFSDAVTGVGLGRKQCRWARGAG